MQSRKQPCLQGAGRVQLWHFAGGRGEKLQQHHDQTSPNCCCCTPRTRLPCTPELSILQSGVPCSAYTLCPPRTGQVGVDFPAPFPGSAANGQPEAFLPSPHPCHAELHLTNTSPCAPSLPQPCLFTRVSQGSKELVYNPPDQSWGAQ